jgi:hypothetical protein
VGYRRLFWRAWVFGPVFPGYENASGSFGGSLLAPQVVVRLLRKNIRNAGHVRDNQHNKSNQDNDKKSLNRTPACRRLADSIGDFDYLIIGQAVNPCPCLSGIDPLGDESVEHIFANQQLV